MHFFFKKRHRVVNTHLNSPTHREIVSSTKNKKRKRKNQGSKQYLGDLSGKFQRGAESEGGGGARTRSRELFTEAQGMS